ncbi:hypothetical protein [Actinoplanes regularis]|uniref:Uncharacterized protein n=1 Tax=Actinoplanes regularis TaxID=52697 RepID=A0A239AZ17_9ACTN|nr:hypothetical protein [Actinoplanes regularis]GIE87279.1 hypothetical protein Are01nite_37590 [Actinoplanes regularis]SNS00562.1 hypothetical protein SAMN06264365_108203 [Actinoplanes regularis]
MTYQPMTMAVLADRLAREADVKVRWKHVWEFFEEFRWAPVEEQPSLLADEPSLTGDRQWDVLLAAMAEHLTARLDLAPPSWSRDRVLATPWFPSSLPSKRMEALVSAPAAFRKHGIYLSARDLEAA